MNTTLYFTLIPRTAPSLLAITVILFLLSIFNNKQYYLPGALQWSLDYQEVVAARIIHESVHYAPGSKDWDTLLPSGGHLVHVEDTNGLVSQHTVTMFHQLRCLDILQKDYMDFERKGPSMLTDHCMNYMRQMILCQLDISAEVQRAQTPLEGADMICKDWTAVYDEAERNYANYERRKLDYEPSP